MDRVQTVPMAEFANESWNEGRVQDGTLVLAPVTKTGLRLVAGA